jgi:hypothetical protein
LWSTECLSERPHISAKIAHEKVIKKSEIPYSIVHATQFVELVKKIADDPRSSNPSPPRYSQSRRSGAVGMPVNGIVEVGPERFRFDESIRRGLRADNDPCETCTI